MKIVYLVWLSYFQMNINNENIENGESLSSTRITLAFKIIIQQHSIKASIIL